MDVWREREDIKLGQEASSVTVFKNSPLGVVRFFNFVRLFVRGTDKKEPTNGIS